MPRLARPSENMCAASRSRLGWEYIARRGRCHSARFGRRRSAAFSCDTGAHRSATRLEFSTILWRAGRGLPDFERIPTELRRDPRRFAPMPEKLFPTHDGKIPHAAWPHDHRWGLAMNAALFGSAVFIWNAGEENGNLKMKNL